MVSMTCSPSVCVDGEGRVTARRTSVHTRHKNRSQSFASIKFFSELDSTIHDQVTVLGR